MEKRYALFIFSLLMIFGFYFMLTMEGGITGLTSFQPQAGPIGACGNISSSGIWTLTGDVAGGPDCINITSGNLVLDCDGHKITPGAGGRAVFSGDNGAGPGFDNITIKNCDIEYLGGGSARRGIELNNVTNATIMDSNITLITTGKSYGIRLSTGSQTNMTRTKINLTAPTFGAPDAVFISGQGGHFYDNTIYTYSSDGTQDNRGFHVSSSIEPLEIYNNFINISSDDDDSWGIYEVSSGNNHKYINNTIWVDGQEGHGIAADSALTISTQIINNTIYMTGRGLGKPSRGIYLRGAGAIIPVEDALIEGNTVRTQQKSLGPETEGIAGIEVTRYTENITVKGNILDLEVGDWTTAYAIRTDSATDISIRDNTINVTGPRANNIGILTASGTTNSIPRDNTIFVNGTGNNYGIYLEGGTAGDEIINNTIRTNGNESGNSAIFANGDATITNNTLLPNGQMGRNTGITANVTTFLIARNNQIITNGTIDNHGIYLLRTNRSTLDKNNITTDGTNTSYGIHVFTGYQNHISNNTVVTPNGAQLQPTLFGARIEQHGIYILGGTGNKILSNDVYSDGDAIRLERENSASGDTPCDSSTVTDNNAHGIATGLHTLFCSDTVIDNNVFTGQEQSMLIEGGSTVEQESVEEGGTGCVQGAPCLSPLDCGDVGSCTQAGTCECSNCVENAECRDDDDCFGGLCFGAASLEELLEPQALFCGCGGGAASLPNGLSLQKATNTSSCQKNNITNNIANGTRGIGCFILGCVQQRVENNIIKSDTTVGLLVGDTHDSTFTNNNITSNNSVALKIGAGGTFFDGFEDQTLSPFTTSGTPWTVENFTAYQGNWSAASGAIPMGGGVSDLTLNETIPIEGGSIQFAIAINIPENDTLKFYIDGTFVREWTNITPIFPIWEVYSFTVDGGNKTFTWSVNQSATSMGARAFVDAVTTIAEATDNAFEGNNLWTNGTNTWIIVGQNSTGNNLTNTTFKESYGEIKLNDKFTIQSPRNVTKAKLNVTENLAFLNSSNLTEFNVSGRIILIGNVGTTATVDFEDDGTFVACNAPQCTNVVTGANVISYDVASFTGYSSEGGEPTPSRRATGGGGNRYAYVPDVIEEKEKKTETKAVEPEKPEEKTKRQKEQPTKTRSSGTRTAPPGPTQEHVKVKKQEVQIEILKPATTAALVLGVLGVFTYVAWRVQRPKDIDKLAKELDRIRDRLKKP